MKLPPILIALASGLILSACASKPFIAPTASIPMAVPLECVLMCPSPPPMTLHRKAWEAATFAWGAACKKLHDDCVEALSR